MKYYKKIKAILYKEEFHDEITKRFLSLGNILKIKYNDNDLDAHIADLQSRGFASKEVVILKNFQGRQFQLCPGTPKMICCNYRNINTGFNCVFGCTYCFLLSYLNSFGIVQFVNTDSIFNELDAFVAANDKTRIYRVGSGQFTDSLVFDDITGIGKKLIERYSKSNLMIELKTKSANIDHLFDIQDKGKAVLAWSLNTQQNISRYESGTASASARIAAAKKAADAGYFTAFHFDPVIIYDGWKADYAKLVDELMNTVPRDSMVWISMGGFRYAPGFKDILRSTYPEEEMTVQEMFPCADGKFRYFKKIRSDMYKTLACFISEYTTKPFVYLCMESADMWKTVFDKDYASSDDLEADMSRHIKREFFL